MAATTLPTTATVQKYPVEASPIPANDNLVLGETLGLRGRGFTPSPGKHGLVSQCCQLMLSLAVFPTSAGLIVVCTVAGISALIVAAICWCR